MNGNSTFSAFAFPSEPSNGREKIYPLVVTITLGILGALAHFRHFSGLSGLGTINVSPFVYGYLFCIA
jgi:hypothetical protein